MRSVSVIFSRMVALLPSGEIHENSQETDKKRWTQPYEISRKQELFHAQVQFYLLYWPWRNVELSDSVDGIVDRIEGEKEISGSLDTIIRYET